MAPDTVGLMLSPFLRNVTGAGDVPTGSVEYKTIFAVGATLFVMTLILNVISIRLVERFREEYE